MPWEQSLYVHRAWLRMLYLAAAWISNCGHSVGAGTGSERAETAKNHILSLSNLFAEVDYLSLASVLPGYSTPLIIVVMNFHRQGLALGTMKERIAVAQRIERLWNVMHTLQGKYDLGDRLFNLLTGPEAGEIWDRISTLQ